MSRRHVTDAQVVEACRLAHANQLEHLRPHAVQRHLAAITGEPLKVVWRAMERAADRGFIEYGVSLRTAWPTEAGRICAGLDPKKYWQGKHGER